MDLSRMISTLNGPINKEAVLMASQDDFAWLDAAAHLLLVD